MTNKETINKLKLEIANKFGVNPDEIDAIDVTELLPQILESARKVVLLKSNPIKVMDTLIEIGSQDQVRNCDALKADMPSWAVAAARHNLDRYVSAFYRCRSELQAADEEMKTVLQSRN